MKNIINIFDILNNSLIKNASQQDDNDQKEGRKCDMLFYLGISHVQYNFQIFHRIASNSVAEYKCIQKNVQLID